MVLGATRPPAAARRLSAGAAAILSGTVTIGAGWAGVGRGASRGRTTDFATRVGSTARSIDDGGRLIQIRIAAAAAASGASQPNVDGRHHRDGEGCGSVRAIAASSAWQRAQSAAWRSTASRARASSVPSDHAASASLSRQPAAGSGVIRPRSVSRSNPRGTSFIDDLLQIEWTRIVGDRRETGRDLLAVEPGLLAQVPLDVTADRQARARKLP